MEQVLCKADFRNAKFVGTGNTLHDIFAKPSDAGNEHDIPETGFRINREDHAGSTGSRMNLLLNTDGKANFHMIETFVFAVFDRMVIVQRFKTTADGFKQVFFSSYVEKQT
jgi:hypothetical protein